MEKLKERFIRYAKINTRSDESSTTIPTTQAQVEFAEMLTKELKEIGLSEVVHNRDNGFVTATLPSNVEYAVNTIGFIAHFDTADFNSENIQPQVIEKYDGNDIYLNKENDIVMKVSDFPNLKNYVGHTLITTDGTTLLGADDKAGLSEIIEAMIYFLENPDVKHGEVRVAFGPDEEIGRGADNFDAPGFRAKFAYTMDGGPLGELEYESFNAAQAKITFQGVSVHPGTAKNKMINASLLAMEYHGQLPADEVPEKTEGYEGFYLLNHMTSTIDSAEMTYIIRDHDREKFNARKEKVLQIAKDMNEKYGVERVVVDMFDSYYNMGEIISKDMTSVELAKEAMNNLGITPDIHPIRGGTDGSKISFMGIPTPNIFTGGENYHGRYEFASLDNMVKAKQVIIEIIKLNAR
jgi:tripeptide aminopeptidase